MIKETKPLITSKQWQDKCRELRVAKDLLRAAEAQIDIQSASIKRLEGVVMDWQVRYATLFEKMAILEQDVARMKTSQPLIDAWMGSTPTSG